MDGDGSSSEEQPEISPKEMFETEMARLFVFVGFFVVGFVLLVVLLLFVFVFFLRKESFFPISV